MPTSTEQHVPRWDVTRIDPQTGQPYVEEARLDVASSDPSTGAPIFMDTVVYCCHTTDRGRLLSRARHDGKAAADNAHDVLFMKSASCAALWSVPKQALD